MGCLFVYARWNSLGILCLLTGCATWDRETGARPLRTNTNAPSFIPTAEVEWKSGGQALDEGAATRSTGIAQVVLQNEVPKTPAVRGHFELPSGLPGANAPDIVVPSLKGLTAAEREKKVREVYPELPALPTTPAIAMPESGRPYSLRDFQELALQKNPAIHRAAADIDVAAGALTQAGLYPNPHVGYQADQVQPGSLPKNNAGQQGAFIQQLIKTGGKLILAQASARMDYENAQVALRRAEVDVVSQVRTGYFNVLVAQETLRVSLSLAELADEVYLLQIKRVATGDTAGYEPLQLYAQSVLARNIAIRARNRYLAAWQQLTASLGEPEMPPMALAEKTDAAVPLYDVAEARQRMLTTHTDLLTAQNTILQAQYNLRLAEVTPISDIMVNTAFQHDNAVGNDQFSLQIGVNLPLFDRNQGKIRSARAQIARASDDYKARQLALLGRLAEAFERYQSNRALVENYRDHILPNLSRAYRSIYQRSHTEPEKVGFNDIVVAQQNLSQALNAYLTAIGDQWTAVIDIANLLQLDDIYQPAK